MVYVLSIEGKPLMPTNRHGKVRRLLKQGLAKVVKVKPFTIQLLYDTTTYTQDITLGIDSGYNNSKDILISLRILLYTKGKNILLKAYKTKENILG